MCGGIIGSRMAAAGALFAPNFVVIGVARFATRE